MRNAIYCIDISCKRLFLKGDNRAAQLDKSKFLQQQKALLFEVNLSFDLVFYSSILLHKNNSDNATVRIRYIGKAVQLF
jgi:hypothetical protein